MNQAHEKLVEKQGWYASWHNNGSHQLIHWLVFLVVGTFVSSMLISNINLQYTGTSAAGTAVICDYYASPNVTSGGNGSSSSPWSLHTALAQNNTITAGKTLCLQDGTYKGKFLSKLNGGTVRSAPGEWAIIDGYQFTTLSAGITATQTSFTVADGTKLAPSIQSGGTADVVIDGEVFHNVVVNGNTITFDNRAAAGSSTGAVAHNQGALVRLARNQLQVGAADEFDNVLYGSNTTYRDFEITNSDPMRNWDTDGTEGIRGAGIAVSGNANKFVNLFIHDNLNGIFSGSSGSNNEIYGNTVYNNGVFIPSRNGGGGHGLYLENKSGTLKALDNIVFDNFGLGTQVYGRSACDPGVTIEGNIYANSAAPVGGFERNLLVGPETCPIDGITIKSNYFFHPMNSIGTNMVLGYGAGVTHGQVLNNYFVGGRGVGMASEIADHATVTGNKFYMPGAGAVNVQSLQGVGHTWNSNTYYATGTNDDKFGNRSTSNNYIFSDWKSMTGYDASSTISAGAMPDTVVVRPNTYEPGRANVVVYNISRASSVNVNLTNAGLTDGQSFKIKNAINWGAGDVTFNGATSAVYNSSSPTINIPLTGNACSVATPVAGTAIASLCPDFAAFVVVPVTAGATPTAPVISDFSATPTTITQGNQTVLNWSVSNADTVTIDNGIGSVNSTDFRAVSPTVTTTYTLAAVKSGQTVTRSVTVTVNPPTGGGTGSTTPCTGANCVNVNTSTTYQTMTGWEATAQAGRRYMSTTAWNNASTQLLDQAVDAGLNRLRVEIYSGSENPTDTYAQFINGQITEDQYNPTRYQIVNDNSDPNSINPAGFNWTMLDDQINTLAIPMRQRLAARGEQLHINVHYVDFGASTFEHKSNAAEYGEFVLATYQHMQSTFGFVPDTWEVILEPDTTSASWSAAQTAAAVKAAGDRLFAAGFTPRIIAPSVTNAGNFSSYVTAIANLSGAMQYIDTLSYHRYGSTNASSIATIANTHSKKTAMNEWIGADYNTLMDDLKNAKNSAWQQFTLAGPASWGADNGDRYFIIDDNNGALTMSSRLKYLRQFFKYIRSGAQRVAATNAGNPFIDPLAFKNADGKVVMVSPVTGSSGPLTFGVNGLPAGTYGISYTSGDPANPTTTVVAQTQTIASGGAVNVNLPQGTVGVVTVYGIAGGTPPTAPAISLNPTSLTFSGVSGGATPATQTSVLTNTGNATLSWAASANTPWCHVTSSSGTSGTLNAGATTNLTVSVDSPSNAGSFSCAITISGTGATSQSINVTYNVSPGVDNTPPTVSMSAPAAGATVSGSAVTVSASATDDVGVVGVQFKLDGSNLGAEDTTSPYSYSWNTTLGIANGNHTLSAVARDAAGNTAPAANITVSVNNAAAQPVSTPTISPNGGTYSSAQSVSLASATSGATIRYTTDGSTPSSTVGTVYSGPFSVATSATVKAIAYKSGSPDSSVASASFTINTAPAQVATPTISPNGATFTTSQTVSLSTSTAGATIRYTTDGSTPSSTVGTVYSSAFTLTSSATVKAIAYKSGSTDSAVASAAFTKTVPPSGTGLTLNPSSLQFNAVSGGATPAPQTVTITNTTGSEVTWGGVWNLDWCFLSPTSNSIPAGGQQTLTVSVDSPSNTGSFACNITFNSNAGGTAPVLAITYTVTDSQPTSAVSTPTISPNGGTYSSAQSVSLASATSGATIRYTTDGSTPSSTVGTVYSGPFSVATSATVKAIAYKSGSPDSSVASASFTINTAPAQVATPTISPNGATFTTSQTVSLSTSTAGATIRYTTDGSTPSSTVGTVYSSAFTLTSSATVKAIAYKSGSTDSAVASAAFTYAATSDAPPRITSIWLSAKTQTSGTISWKTNNVTTTGTIAYGTIRTNLNQTVQETNPPSCNSTTCTHTATISGLTRNTTYYYRITSVGTNGTYTTNRYSFKTSR